MDKVLPRGAPRSLMTFSKLLPRLRPSSSSSSSYTLSHAHCFSSSYLNKERYIVKSVMPAMEKSAEHTSFLKDNKEAIKEQQRESYCKGACDYPPDDILPHIINLYASRATARDFEIYAPDATFEDPLMCAHGIKQIKSAFYSIGKVFSESRIVEYSIKENIISPGKKEMLIDNKQYYKFLGKDINMISLIKLYIEEGKVVRHEDWWDKKPIWNRDTVKVPLVGRMSELLRRGSMLTTHALMGCGKDPKI